jgi:hypothetical protein
MNYKKRICSGIGEREIDEKGSVHGGGNWRDSVGDGRTRRERRKERKHPTTTTA